MKRLSVTLAIGPHHQDHRFAGQAVLPAVDTLQVLAATVHSHLPAAVVTRMRGARFERFLTIAADAAAVDAVVDLSQDPAGRVTAALSTRVTAGTSGITRTKTHGQVSFDREDDPPIPPPADVMGALEGVCFTVDAAAVYRELVPFGQAYRNIDGPLLLSADGAVAPLAAPDLAAAGERPLGSPFPLDAAFHAACVWGQRFAGVVAFPVAIARRCVFSPTSAGGRYLGRVFPVSMTGDHLLFDIWICNEDGSPCEAAIGVEMRDVSGGRWLPPAWIRAGCGAPGPEHLTARTAAVRIVELAAVTTIARSALAPAEAERFAVMGARRQRSFLAARIACKRLARSFSAHWHNAPADTIITVSADDPRPVCPPAAFCSVAHDGRFAVAVAGPTAIGVDVEPATPRALKTQRIYMSAAEQALVAAASMGPAPAAVRVWTAKEAAAKALGMTLAQAMTRVQITAIGDGESRLLVDAAASWTVWHDMIDDHLFTLFDATAGG